MPLQSSERATSLLQRLLVLSTEAASSGDYEVAYHALMAALHAAEGANSPDGVRAVVKAAKEQAAGVEAIRPAHQLSAAAAKLRGTQPVYRSILVHAEAVRLRLKVSKFAGRSISTHE